MLLLWRNIQRYILKTTAHNLGPGKIINQDAASNKKIRTHIKAVVEKAQQELKRLEQEVAALESKTVKAAL